VYGIVTHATHAELERLYHHASAVLGGVYLPEAILVELEGNRLMPALCYISHTLDAAPADAAYVDRIVVPARQYGFPRWYLEHLESFRP